MRKIEYRQLPVGVIQICCMDPDPEISAMVNVCPALITTDGLTFQLTPRSRAGPAPVPVVAFPPAPLAPLKFSGLMLRLLAGDRRKRLERLDSTPLKGV